jgi:hypothetical protein
MIAVSVTFMKPATFPLLLVLSFTLTALPSSGTSPGNPPSGSAVFSADDFDWRDMVADLFSASAQPAEQGLKSMLENSQVLRAYVANDVRAECKAGSSRCDSSLDGFTVDGEVTRRIDGIVKEGLVHQHRSAVIDYSFQRPSFPFTQISALRSENRKDAYLVLQFADHTYRAVDVQAKYGQPYDTDVFLRYSVFKYRLVSAHYISKAVFEVNPVDGAVMKLAISVKTRKHH